MAHDEYASKGLAGAGLGIGVGALALLLLKGSNWGSFGDLLGGGNGNGATAVILDAERRLARLEAAEAANAVALVKDAQIAELRDRYIRRETRLEIEAATCDCIRGQVMMNPNQMADPYEGSVNRLVTRHGHGHCGYGCGDHGHGHGHYPYW